jgi:hypothetical protein
MLLILLSSLVILGCAAHAPLPPNTIGGLSCAELTQGEAQATEEEAVALILWMDGFLTAKAVVPSQAQDPALWQWLGDWCQAHPAQSLAAAATALAQSRR